MHQSGKNLSNNKQPLKGKPYVAIYELYRPAANQPHAKPPICSIDYNIIK
jgi:hypothetical protein